MASTAPDADERPPERMLGREDSSSDEPGAVEAVLTTGDLRCKGQEELIQEFFREKISDQMRSALYEDNVGSRGGTDGL